MIQSHRRQTRPMHWLGLFIGALAIASASAGKAGASVTIVENGEPRATLVLPAEPEQPERQAADELVEHIQLITTATLPIVSTDEADENADLTPIRIGSAADEALDERIREIGDAPSSFALIAETGDVQLRGLTPEGTRIAAYELLEQLGVRWYMAGDIGRVVPERDTVALEVQRTLETPSYIGRPGLRNDDGDWNRRLRSGGQRRYGAHGIAPFRGGNQDRYFEQNPEYFALIDGQRQPRQLCLTNSTDNIEDNEVLAHVVDYYREYLRENPDTRVLNMGPNDGGGYCECDHCEALDPPGEHTTPLATPEPSLTDRYVWFFNQLTEALADEFPDVRIGFYAYANHLLPPIEVEARDNLAISLAPIHVCRLHGPNNPACPESNFPLWAYEQWRPYAGTFMADRGYLFNLADPGFPLPLMHRLREEIPAFYDAGVRIWGASPPDSWASHTPGAYLLLKMLWDHNLDVDALLDEFYELFYGPAAEPMEAYHTLLDATLRDADHHTGSIWDIPNIYTPQVRSAARAHLEEAASRAEGHDDAYATRVAIMTRSLDLLDAYCELRERRDAFDFEGEYAAMQRAAEFRDRLLEDYDHPMLYPRQAESLFNRFVETPTQRIYDSLDGGDVEIVARFDHQWKFFQDPEQWGQYIGLHEPQNHGGNWQTIRTDMSWSNQGLRYYFGQAWYRQSVSVPAEYEGETVNLWFAGVDSTAEVWVNGQFVGANHDGAAFDLDAYGSAFRPFQFDATQAIRFGDDNVVTVRTYRHRTNELGTGGLIGPAMFHIPNTPTD